MEIQEFYSWPGLKRYLQNTGRLIDLISTVVELEKLPVKDRKIIIKESRRLNSYFCNVFIYEYCI